MSVRVPDERLDAREANLTAALTWVPHPHRVPAAADLAALVADLRDARADNQRLRESLRGLLNDDDLPNEWGDCVCSMCLRIRAARAALAEEPRA